MIYYDMYRTRESKADHEHCPTSYTSIDQLVNTLSRLNRPFEVYTNESKKTVISTYSNFKVVYYESLPLL